MALCPIRDVPSYSLYIGWLTIVPILIYAFARMWLSAFPALDVARRFQGECKFQLCNYIVYESCITTLRRIVLHYIYVQFITNTSNLWMDLWIAQRHHLSHNFNFANYLRYDDVNIIKISIFRYRQTRRSFWTLFNFYLSFDEQAYNVGCFFIFRREFKEMKEL